MIDKLNDAFINKEIDKTEYSERMYVQHEQLFHYAELINHTDVKSIEIIQGNVIVTSNRHNIKMVCQKDDIRAVPYELINIGEYEIDDSNLIYSFILDNHTVFDIGANSGWYSMGLTKNKKSINMYAFEPMPKTYNQLVKNIKLNDLTGEINIYNHGLSDKDGNVEFYYFPNNSGNSSMAKMNDGVSEKMVLKVKRLDTFVDDNKVKKIDFIKCDVEGAELLVFKGGMKTIKRDKPIIFAEMLRKWAAKYDYHPNVIINMFKEIEYRCFVSRNGKLEEFFIMDEDTVETNYLFIHKDSWANEKVNS